MSRWTMLFLIEMLEGVGWYAWPFITPPPTHRPPHGRIQIIDHQTDKKYRGNQGKNSGNAIMQGRPAGRPCTAGHIRNNIVNNPQNWAGVPGIQLTQQTGRARLSYRHLSFWPSAAQGRNLILSVTCQSQGDSGLPLRGNRNDRSGAGMCCYQAVWLSRCNRAELSG